MEEINRLTNIVTIIIDFCIRYSFQIIGALIILGIGFYIAGWVSKLVLKLCKKNSIDITLSSFLAQIARLVIISFVLIMALGKFGISVAPLVAAMGAMVFGASFALQGVLSNYTSGLSIIVSRPFVVGDTILVNNVRGVVEEVSLATTTLATEDGEKITIPNKQIVGEVLINSYENKIVESTIGISYNDDPEAAIKIIRSILLSNEKITDQPHTKIGIEEFGDSSINIGIRYWVPTKEYFETMYEINLSIYKKLKEENITMPYPHREVNLVAQ